MVTTMISQIYKSKQMWLLNLEISAEDDFS